MAFIGNRSPQSFLLRAMAQRRQGGQGGMQPAPMQNRKGGSQGKPWSKVRQQEQMAQRQMPPPPNYAQAQREQAMQQRGWTPNETNQILSGQQRQGGIADLMQQRGQAMQGLMGGAGDIYGQQMGGGVQMPPPPNYEQAVQQQAMAQQQMAQQPQFNNQPAFDPATGRNINRWAMGGMQPAPRQPFGSQTYQQQPVFDPATGQSVNRWEQMQQAPQGNRKGGGMQQAPQGSRKGA